MLILNQGRINLILATSAFTISSAGSVLLHIVFAIAIYSQTGSGLLTSLFVSLQWLPALLVILYRSDWDHGLNPRKRWYLLDCLSALLTLPVLYYVIDSPDYLPIVLILLVRGIVDQINRINKTVICRFLFPKEKATHYASFLQTGYHFGIGLAAVAGIFIADKVDLKTIVLIDMATFLVAAALVTLTKCVADIDFPKTAPRQSLKIRIQKYSMSLNGDARLFFCAILPPLTATFFQGTYSVLQPIFPLVKLQLDSSAVSASYVMASVAIFTGSSSFAYLAKKTHLFEKSFSTVILIVGVLSLVSSVTYLINMSSNSIWLAAICFFVMVFLFEFIWMTGYAGIVAYSPKNQLGSVFGISFAIGCLMGSVAAAFTGYLLDILNNNFSATIGIFMFLYLSVLSFAYIMYKRLSSLGTETRLAKA